MKAENAFKIGDIKMKKFIISLAAALLVALTSTGCVSTSKTSSSSGTQSADGKTNTQVAAKRAYDVLTGAGVNTWLKKENKNLTYYILYSDSAVTSNVRSDVTINKGLTIMVTTTSDSPIGGLTSSTFAVKSFGSTATESSDGSSQTFTLNDGAFSYYYSKNEQKFTALSELPAQLKAENTSRYTNVTKTTAADFNWKQILIDYLAGTL